MLPIINKPGPASKSEISWEDGNTSNYFGKNFQNIIKQANSISIIELFNFYKIKIDIHNRKIICPFKSHKNGQESGASFNFYPETNTFWCFGCKAGPTNCDLVMGMEKFATRHKAAEKILSIFNLEAEDSDEVTASNNKLPIIIQFSNSVKKFRSFHDSEESNTFLDKICCVFDDINDKHQLNDTALQSVVDNLQEKLNSYTCKK